MLLDPKFKRQLKGLRFTIDSNANASPSGTRVARTGGSSQEFLGFREYVAGDDLRHVDWKAFARLEKLFVKQFESQTDSTIAILLDTSDSMRFGTPSKMDCAREIASALAYVATSQIDRVTIHELKGGECRTVGPSRGDKSHAAVVNQLDSLNASGQNDLNLSVGQFVRSPTRAKVVAVLSDFMDDAVIESISRLKGSRRRVLLFQILSREELEPQIDDNATLVDSESGREVDVLGRDNCVREYQSELYNLQQNLLHEARRIGGEFWVIDASIPLVDTFSRAVSESRIIVRTASLAGRSVKAVSKVA